VSIPNAEPFHLPGNQIAILMIHGFSGSPASIRPWAEGLNARVTQFQRHDFLDMELLGLK
jgi:esterase/lipase